MSYSSEVTADAPIWWGRFQETSGTTCTDASGGGHNGTYNNTPTLAVAGPIASEPSDTAVSFASASSEDMRVAFWSGLNIQTFTLEAWVKGTGTNQAIFGRQGTTGTPYCMFVDSTGHLQIVIKTSGTTGPSYSASGTINDGNWHHCVITRDNTTADLKFYIDGVLDSTVTGSSAPGTATSNGLAVASRGGSPFYNGSIDEPALYNTVLSGTRIAAHFNAAKNVVDASATATATATAAVVLGTGIDASATATVTGTAAMAGSDIGGSLTAAGSLSAAAVKGVVGAASLTATATATATASKTKNIDASATATATVTATMVVPFEPVSGTIDVDSDMGYPFTGTPPAPGPLISDGTIDFTFSGTLRNLNIPEDVGYRVLVVNMDGEPINELVRAIPGDVKKALSDHDQFSFTLSANDPDAADVQAHRDEIQVWRGKSLIFWGLVVRVRDDDLKLTVQCSGLTYYFTRRVFGEVPKKNMLTPSVYAWTPTYLPRSTPTTAPARSYSSHYTYNEHYSMGLSSSSGFTTQTADNDVIFFGDGVNLTTAGKTFVDGVLADTFGPNPNISIHVYDDNELSPDPSIDRAQARLDSITDYILTKLPGAFIHGNADAYRHAISSNSTSGGRNDNRRTTFRYRDDDGRKGHKQCVYQRFVVKNPKANQKKRLYTFSAFGYVANASGWAANFKGLEIVRYDPHKSNPDKAWRRRGYKKIVKSNYSVIGPGTPVGAWVRYQASVLLPNDGKSSIIEVRLYPPNGDIYWTEWWLTSDDSLWFKERDQASIVNHIVQHAQDPAYGKSDLNIGTYTPLTKVTRSREYLFSERQNVYDALAEWPTLANGMDFDVVVKPDKRTFRTWFPRRGNDTDVVLEWGGDIVNYTVDLDGTQISTSVILQNDGQGSSREERSVSDASQYDNMVLEKVYMVTPNSPASSWYQQALRGLARYRRPVIIPQITVRPDRTSDLLARVSLGDRIMVKIKDMWLDTAQMHRVTSITISPTGDRVTYDLYPEDINLTTLSKFGSTVKYKSAVQDGSVTTYPHNTHPEYAGAAYDDSSWSSGPAVVGWFKEASNPDFVYAAAYPPKTTVTEGHEVWIRKHVKCTGDMYLNVIGGDWFYVFVNGNLVGKPHGSRNHGGGGRWNIKVPQAYLDPSGDQVVTVHSQFRPDLYASDHPDSCFADVAVLGTYDPRLVL